MRGELRCGAYSQPACSSKCTRGAEHISYITQSLCFFSSLPNLLLLAAAAVALTARCASGNNASGNARASADKIIVAFEIIARSIALAS
jgi:hypothetical protein